jgi:hypothetical protein
MVNVYHSMISRRSLRRLLCAGAVTIAAAAPRASLAGDETAPSGARRGDNAAAADALFNEAKRLAEEGNHAEACPKFEASFNLDPTLGTLLNLADCHERSGKIATAWAEWGEGAERAEAARDNRADYAKERRAALELRLPRLAIAVANPKPGFTVLRDDVVVPAATYGIALPVDPGKHMIRVKRGDQVIAESSIETAETKTETVELDLAAIEKTAPPPNAPPNVIVLTPPSDTRRTIGFVVGGAGLTLLAGAAVLEIVALSAKPGDDQCRETFCTPAGYQSATKAKTFANIGQWVGLGGLVAVGVGTVLVLTAPKITTGVPATASARPRAWISPWVGSDGGGMLLGGSL